MTVARGAATARVLDHLDLAILYLLVGWPAVASGGYKGWSLATAQLLALAGSLVWLARMIVRGRLEWRRSVLDGPFVLLVLVIGVQLALGNGPLVEWALDPVAGPEASPRDLPPLWFVGTISPSQTLHALLLLLTYAAAYMLTVQRLRDRRHLERFVEVLMCVGGGLAFLSLLDYLVGDARLIFWRDTAMITRRLFGTFANPNHFAAWLGMVVCLALGYRAARPPIEPGEPVVAEARLRDWLVLVAVALMAIAVVFTLSRGAIASLLVGVALVFGLRAPAHARRTFLAALGLAIVVVAAVAWFGVDPLVARLMESRLDAERRWVQWVTSLPIIAASPVFGVGLGAYGDVYYRYQPLVLQPGKLRYLHAHNDLLQFVTEVGLVGTAVGLVALWRLGCDLGGAHLFGWRHCPVAEQSETMRRRRDHASLGFGLGGISAVILFFVHCGVDFSARIPANGVLVAVCLGIATVALHSRFHGAERSLERTWVIELGTVRKAVVAAAAAVVATVAVPVVVRPALVEAAVQGAQDSSSLTRADEAVRRDPADMRARRTRAAARMDAAMAVRHGSDEERRRQAIAYVAGAIEDLVAAVRRVPTEPSLHERLGWAHSVAAHLGGGRDPAHFRSALASFRRAILLAPANPYLYQALADFALTQEEPILEIGLPAAREAVRRDPELLPHEVDRFLWLALPGMDWNQLVPAAALDRLRVAGLLEDRGRFVEAETLYQAAVAVASAVDEPLVRWMYGRFLLVMRKPDLARVQVEAALRHDPGNPELQLTLAMTLAARGDAAALGVHEQALKNAEARGEWVPFPQPSPSLTMLISERIGSRGLVAAARYRRALAQYLTDRRLWQSALTQWEQVAREPTPDATSMFSFGLALDATGASGRALTTYRRAVALDPGNVTFRRRFATSLWENEQFAEAIAEWRQIVTADPADIEARLALARAYVRAGAREDAAHQYESVLRISQDVREAREGLARLGGRR